MDQIVLETEVINPHRAILNFSNGFLMLDDAEICGENIAFALHLKLHDKAATKKVNAMAIDRETLCSF